MRRLRPAFAIAVCASTIACAARGGASRPDEARATRALSCRADDAIAWQRPDDADDRAALDAWCGTVGPPVVRRAGTDAASAAIDDVAFVTFNVHVGAADLDALMADIRAGRLTPRPPRHVVLLLQEALRAGADVPATIATDAPVPAAIRPGRGARAPADVVALAAALRMHLVYVPSMRNGRGPGPDGAEDRGNAILSTLPLADLSAIELPLLKQRRVAVAATITLTDERGARPFRIATLHLDASRPFHRGWLFASGGRARQARAAAASLALAEAGIVAADLNTWSEGPAEPAPRALAGLFPDTPPIAWRPTFRGIWRLDYLFFRLPRGWRGQSQTAGSTYGSDHRPVVGWISR